MKKLILCAALASIFLIAILQNVSAYHDDVYVYSNPNFNYFYNYRTGYGGYSVSAYPRYDNFRRLNFRNDFTRRDAIRFLDESFNARYDATAGKTSGEAFCPNCDNSNTAPTNFRYERAYDLRTDGTGNNKNYYYEQTYDYNLGYYNWRF